MARGISGMLDLNKLANALARPGIDTRVQSSLAYARAESFYDKDHGVFVDVTLSPSGQQITARVPANYAGALFGFYARIHKDDELLLVLPGGDPSEGSVVVARLWSAADKPPEEAGTDPDEVMLIVEKDKHLRLKTSGTGMVEILSESKVTVKTVGDGVVEILSESSVKIDLGGPVLTMTPDSIDIDAGSKPCNVFGGDIVLNGGSAKVARVGDKTTSHTHTLISGQAGPYPVATLTISNEEPTISEGAAKVKA